MRIRRSRAALAVTCAALGTLALTAPARAASSGGTFTLTSGTLSISAPAGPVNLGSASAGSLTLSGSLGNVTVTDGRGSLVATWTATVDSTDFTTGTATANETVAKSSIAYSAGVASATTGIGTFVPGVAASLAAPSTAGAWTAGSGSNSATWNPTLTFTLSGSQVAGVYSGTITHSVA